MQPKTVIPEENIQAMDLAKKLKRELLRHLSLPEPVILTEETPITDAIQKMQEFCRGCVLVEKEGMLCGLVTERDILVKYMGCPGDTFFTLKEIMTLSPTTLSPDDSLEKAIQVMTQGGYRHVPIVDAQNRIIGLLAVRNIVSYLSEHFPTEVYNLPPRLEQKMESPEGA